MKTKDKKMKKILIIFIAAMTLGLSSYAQKFVFVDTDYILNKVPAYKTALEQIDQLAEQWQGDIAKEYDAIDRMYKQYQAETVLLSETMRQNRENEIIEREKQVKAMQKSKFGVDGELFQKRQDLIRPIQESIFKAIDKMAKQKAYDFVLDKSAGNTILYGSDKYDKSDEILSNLGY